MAQSPYLSVGEVATLLGKSVKWCYQQLNAGNIPGAFRIGHSTWFIDRGTLQETLKQKASKPQPKVRQTGGQSRHDLS